MRSWLVLAIILLAAFVCLVVRGAAEAAEYVKRMLNRKSSADLSVFPVGGPIG